jgi:hypothetical protein
MLTADVDPRKSAKRKEHIMTEENIPDTDLDTEGHMVHRDEVQEDTEGHMVHRDDDEDDTEGHGFKHG